MLALLLRRSGMAVKENGLVEWQLVPNLTPQQDCGAVRAALLLATAVRLRRERPHVVVFVDEQAAGRGGFAADRSFIQSCVKLGVTGRLNSRPYYVKNGDPSPFVSEGVASFILFLPERPPSVLPAWPDMVEALDGVCLEQTSDFLSLSSVDPGVARLVNSIPHWTTGFGAPPRTAPEPQEFLCSGPGMAIPYEPAGRWGSSFPAFAS